MGVLDKAAFRKMANERYALSNNQAKRLLSKHQLGDLVSLNLVGGNFTNSVFECQTKAGDHFIFKIQYRPGNQPLEADRDVTLLLQDVLPVPEVCIFDPDGDVIPFPTLILAKLPGHLAESIFENTTHKARITIARILGEILAAIHATPVDEKQVPRKSLFCLNEWRERISEGLFLEEGLRHVLEGIDPTFYPRLQRLLDQMPDLHFEETFSLVWADPTFHNFNVSVDGEDIHLSGVFDFQTAGWGNPIFDRFYLDGNFGRTQADGLYQIPDYLNACYEAYTDCGLTFPEVSETERRLRGAILKANGPKWWWDAAKVLPPFTANTLAGLLEDLEWLITNAK